jgi:hypothetical protein
MTDDDRRLADRLRRYESRVPVDVGAPITIRPRAIPWGPLAGVAAVLVLAVVVATNLIADRPAVGEASPTPAISQDPTASQSASAPASIAPSMAPEASEAPQSAVPTPSPVPATGLPSSWSITSTIREAGRTIVVSDLTEWNGGAIAVGTRYAVDSFSVFGPPPDHAGRIWSTNDGLSWSDVTPEGAFGGIELDDIFVTGDGTLVLIGTQIVDPTSLEQESRVWTSRDGRIWEPGWLDPIPTGGVLGLIAHGPRGYAVVSRHRIWHSPDGMTWEAVFDLSDLADDSSEVGITGLDAGDEGFVATVYRTTTGDDPAQTPGTIASGDGRAWVIGSFGAHIPDIAIPWGPDWLGVESFPDDDDSWSDGLQVRAFRSANGLDWTDGGTLTFGGSGADAVDCVEFPVGAVAVRGAAYMSMMLSYPCSEGRVRVAGSAWATEDGVTWVRLPLGDHAAIGGVATVAGRVVVATHVGTGSARDAGVTFWIGEDHR